MNKGLIFAGGVVLGGAIGAGAGVLTLLSAELRSDTIREALAQDIAARACRCLNIPAKPWVTYTSYHTYQRQHTPAYDCPVHERPAYLTNLARGICFDSREAAKETLTMLNEIIKTYGVASYADLCDLLGLKPGPPWTSDYGWHYTLSPSHIHATHRGNYQIDFPWAGLLDLEH